MSNTTAQIDLDELLRRLDAEVAQRRAQRGEIVAAPVPASVPRPWTPPRTLAPRDSYALADFLALDDAAFVEAAYRGLLRRGGDPQGSGHYLAELRCGRLGKVDVLGRLRYSAEGRARGVKVRGLPGQFVMRSIYRLPVVGYLVSWFVHLLRLPTLVRNLEQFETYSRTHQHGLYASDLAQAEALDASLAALRADVQRGQAQSIQRQELDRLESDLDLLRTRVADELEESRGLLARHVEGQGAELQAVASSVAELGARVDRISAGMDARLGQAEQNEQSIASMQARIGEQLGALASAQLDRAALDAQLARLDQRLETKADLSAVAALNERLLAVGEHKADRGVIDLLRMEVEARVAQLAGSTDVESKLGRLERFIYQVRDGIGAVNRKLEPARAQDLEATSQASAGSPPDAQSREGFYAALEETFRGSREDIRKRAEPFVEVLAQVQAGTGLAPVLDLGCGRGEWLELLRDRGMVARGVDLNGIFVARCAELGLEVTEGDALAMLASLPDHSLGAVTGFHIVEHLPLESVLRLFEQSRRVLRPGGVLILETPNPENLAVGACNFYYDPTHRNPLPPLLLEFIGRHCGYPRVEVRRLAEFREMPALADLPEDAPDAQVLNPVIALVRQAWYGPPDYALVAYSA